MKTRYTSLVALKKSTMQKSERVLQSANADTNSAAMALQISYNSLDTIHTPQTGHMSEILASRALLSSQRDLINHNKEWVNFAKEQAEIAKEKLKTDMIEYEKFNYLEVQEIKKILQEIKVKEAKDLDEVALMIHAQKLKNEG